MDELHSSKEGVSILFYMQMIYPGEKGLLFYFVFTCFFILVQNNSYYVSILLFILDEWKNFLERMGCENSDGVKDEKELRNWASFRGQTLSRTGE
jgi:callose synthase